MKAIVDQDTCIGCGLCPSIAPDVFEMQDDGKAHTTMDPVTPDYVAGAKESEESCPVNAIEVK
jgi:ferredoxin